MAEDKIDRQLLTECIDIAANIIRDKYFFTSADRRFEAGVQIVRRGDVDYHTRPPLVLVRSENVPGKWYVVSPKYEDCNCADCQARKIMCKHLVAWRVSQEARKLYAARLTALRQDHAMGG